MQNLISISKIWNDSLDNQINERVAEPRDRIWASELGKADIDVYLKLMGEEVSNPFDSRARRKFEAGNLFEWIVKIMLQRAGVYQKSQERITQKLSAEHLMVSGYLDHLIGGTPTGVGIDDLGLPELFARAGQKILRHFQEKYPNGIPEQGIEVKSTSSFGIEKVYYTNKALAGHDLQAFHYAYTKNIPFTLLYICRDDLRIAELPVLPDNKELFEQYEKKIASISHYYKNKQEPPKEPEIVWNEETDRFSKNFNVEYSSYLKRNYGYEKPDEYSDKWSPVTESWNRVITRIKSGKEMTANNQEKLEQMREMGFGSLVDSLINKYENK